MLDDLSVAIISTLVPFTALCYAYCIDMHRIRRYRQDSGFGKSPDAVMTPPGLIPVHKLP